MLNVLIDPTFSVYQLVNRSLRDKASISQRRTMSIVSREIEDTTLRDGAKTVVFAAFQHMSRFLPQEKRCRQLAAKSHHIFVFGVPDVDVPEIENISYIPLRPVDQLAREWFLLSYGRDYFTALATEEITRINDPDRQRRFRGVWTFDPFIVETLYEWLSMTVGQRMEQRLLPDHDCSKQAQFLSNTIGRMQVRLYGEKEQDTVNSEIQKMMRTGLYPVLDAIKTNPTIDTLRPVLQA